MDSGPGSFEVRLLLNGRRVTVVMTFDFETGRVYYKTTRGSGQVDGFDPPAEFRRFMNDEFVRFFVFDGELAEHLLDRQQVDAELVVEVLFQVNALEILERRVRQHWERLTRNVSATDERGLTRRENRLERLYDRLKLLMAEQKKLMERSDDLGRQIKQQREAYDLEIKKVEARSLEVAEAETKADDINGKTREQALSVLDKIRDPHSLSPYFAQALYELKLGLDRVKLPESAAREFFEELATEEFCVCGRLIDDDVSSVIRSRASQYLSSDDVSLLNSMKTAIQDAVGQSRILPEGELQTDISELETLVGQRRDALNELDELHLAAERSDPAVKRASELIQELAAKLLVVDRELEKYESPETEQSDERTFGITVIVARLKDAEDKVAEITNTMELKEKRDTLVLIIQDARTKAHALINAEICAATNERIRRLLPYNRILIDRIDRCLVLQDQEGGSAGETLSVAYAFLATLFNRSEHVLPFIVDSPAGSIDLGVRPRIGELIPKLTNQFVAFTISSEREGFIPRLKEAAGGAVQFVTLFRKGAIDLEDVVSDSSLSTQSRDGVVVQGEDFFNAFQLDTEDV
jgi:hypothetical protein